MKTQAFELMDHIADSLAIHPAVVDLAKVEFSRFRDVREAIQQYDGVVASCLALAFQGTFCSPVLVGPFKNIILLLSGEI